MYRIPETLTFTPFPFFSKRTDAGPRVRVCYSFYQFLGRIFFCFFGNVKKAPIVCWKTVMLRMFGGVMWVQVCVKSEDSHLMIIAINVKYASAAKAASVSFTLKNITELYLTVVLQTQLNVAVSCTTKWLGRCPPLVVDHFFTVYLIDPFHPSAHFKEHMIL